jgi:hypothetical protein
LLQWRSDELPSYRRRLPQQCRGKRDVLFEHNVRWKIQLHESLFDRLNMNIGGQYKLAVFARNIRLLRQKRSGCPTISGSLRLSLPGGGGQTRGFANLGWTSFGCAWPAGAGGHALPIVLRHLQFDKTKWILPNRHRILGHDHGPQQHHDDQEAVQGNRSGKRRQWFSPGRSAHEQHGRKKGPYIWKCSGNGSFALQVLKNDWQGL